MKVALSGGAVTTLASGQSPSAIAVDATSVYWANCTAPCLGTGMDGSIVRVAVAGGTPATLATAQNDPGAIAVDGTNVYWLDLGSGGLWKLAKP